MRRWAVTLLIPLVLWLGDQVSLTGSVMYGRQTITLGLFALGIMPLLSGFLAVELLAVLVPRWRKLRRHADLEGRKRLAAWSLVAGMAFALVQAWLLMRFTQSTLYYASDGAGPVTALSWMAGTAVLAVLARLVSQYGIGNGLLLIALYSSLRVDLANLWHGMELRWIQDGMAMILPCVGSLVLLGVVVRVTRWALPERLPSSGATPFTLPEMMWATALGFTGPSGWVLPVILTVVAVVVFAWIFERPAALDDPTWRARVGRSLAFTLGLVAVDAAIIHLLGPRTLPRAVDVVVYVAVLMDLGRRRGVTVAATTRFDDLDAVVTRLRAAGLSPSVRGQFFGVLARAFGPFAPMEIEIPKSEVAAAVLVSRPPV